MNPVGRHAGAVGHQREVVSNSGPKSDNNPKHRDRVFELSSLIIKLINFNSLEEKQHFQAITYLLHEIIITEADEMRCLEMINSLFEMKSLPFVNILLFIRSWISYGKPSLNLLIEMKKLIKTKANVDQELVQQIDEAIRYTSPVVGRWSAKTTPKDNMLAWMNKKWRATEIGAVLTEMCLPFYRLRPWEFKEKGCGPHLDLLNKRCTQLTMFVGTSILAAAKCSEKTAFRVAKKWLKIAEDLNSRNNFHMMFAIQNGLKINAVDRLAWLSEGLSEGKSAIMRQRLEGLFDIEKKMIELTTETEQLAGNVAIIPCIYWLYNKAILSREAPLFLENGKINMQRVISANNIFEKMIKMQALPYGDLKAADEIRWYFMHIENQNWNVTEDKLRDISNSVLTKEARSTYVPIQEPISWNAVFVNAHIPQLMRKKPSLPARLSSSRANTSEVVSLPLSNKKKSSSLPDISESSNTIN